MVTEFDGFGETPGNGSSIDDAINEEISVAVAKTIRKKGYGITDVIGGKRIRTPDDKNVVGILTPYKWYSRQKASHIGTLWLDNKARDAKLDKRWILEVFGNDYLPKLNNVAKDLSKLYHVQVEAVLTISEPVAKNYR